MYGDKEHTASLRWPHLATMLAATLILSLFGCSASDDPTLSNGAGFNNGTNNGSADASTDATGNEDVATGIDTTSADAGVDSTGHADAAEDPLPDIPESDAPDDPLVGADCASDEDCPSELCESSESRDYCTQTCESAEDCVAGWTCRGAIERDARCTCEASAEICDGIDNDCDGLVDEGTSADLGCEGSLCIDGACRCPAAYDCNGDCVDLRDSAQHCGGCGISCDVACSDYACVGVEQTSVASMHACALLSDRTVRCVGANDAGQAGTGTLSETTSTPAGVLWLDDVNSLSASGRQSCAVHDGEVWCWGANDGGVIAASSAPSFARPIRRHELDDIARVDVFDGTACAVDTQGTVSCWGGPDAISPQPISDIPAPVEDVAVGPSFRCALLETGQISCWGQLPISGIYSRGLTGDISLSTLPIISNATRIDVGAEHICALTDTGALYCLGQNRDGQLGFDEIDALDVPQKLGGIGQVADMATGDDHTCAVNQSGDVYCWGLNNEGQLGDGTTRSSFQPTQLAGLPPAVSISAGANATCAIVESGELYCWGRSFGINPRSIQW